MTQPLEFRSTSSADPCHSNSTSQRTFALAYAFGSALTVGPLVQEGVGLGEAMLDALYSGTPSITLTEVAAIGTDLLIAGRAHVGDLLFWGALVFSLSVGFVVAFPVDAALVYFGVKEGMKNPAEMGRGQGQQS